MINKLIGYVFITLGIAFVLLCATGIDVAIYDDIRDSDWRACMHWRHPDVCKAQLELQRAEDYAQIEDELSTPEGRARFDAENPDIAAKTNF